MNRSLKPYQGQDIRNVAVVGHAHCGKTTLISALLHAAKMTERLGRVDDGSAVTAYDEEDVARRTQDRPAETGERHEPCKSLVVRVGLARLQWVCPPGPKRKWPESFA